MADSDLTRMRVPKLKSAADYRSWRRAIDGLFDSLNLTDYVTGLEEEPEDVDRADYGTPGKDGKIKLTADQKSAYDLARLPYTDWRVKDGKARAIIVASVPDYLADQLPNTAKAQYDFICERYGDEGPGQKQVLLCNLLYANPFDGKDLQEFINKWTQSLAKYTRAGITISDEMKVLLFVCNIDVSSKFKRWIDNVRDKLRRNEKVMLESIIQDLMDNWKTRETSLNTSNIVANTRGNNKGNNKSKGGKSDRQGKDKDGDSRKCECCGNAHNTKLCYHLHPEKARPGFKKNQELVDAYNNRDSNKSKSGGTNALMNMAIVASSTSQADNDSDTSEESLQDL